MITLGDESVLNCNGGEDEIFSTNCLQGFEQLFSAA